MATKVERQLMSVGIANNRGLLNVATLSIIFADVALSWHGLSMLQKVT